MSRASNLINLGTRQVNAKADLSIKHLNPKMLGNQLFKRVRRIGNIRLERTWNVDFLCQHTNKKIDVMWTMVVTKI